MWHCRRPRCFVVHTGLAQLILVCARVYIPKDNNSPVTLALNLLWTMEVNKFHSLIHFEASHYNQCDSRLYPGVCMDPINFLDTLMKAFALSMSQVDQIDCVTGILLSIQYQILFSNMYRCWYYSFHCSHIIVNLQTRQYASTKFKPLAYPLHSFSTIQALKWW